MLVTRKILLAHILLLAISLAVAAPESITLNYKVINNFPVKYVAINMTDPDVVVTTAVAAKFPFGLESWRSFLNRLNPAAAINGTYFCTQSYQPVGDVAIAGALLYRGAVGTALCIAPDNRVAMLPGPRQAKSDWSGFQSVLCAGPRLLTNGRLTLAARAEGFRDPRVLGSAPRSAVALRPDGLLLLLTIEKNISLENLAYVCMHLGAVQAMALDGGSSSSLYANGRTVTGPGRTVSNIIAVYATRQQYRLALQQLAPRGVPVLARLLEKTAPVVGPYADVEYADNTAFSFHEPAMSVQAPPLIQLLSPNPLRPITGTTAIDVRIGQDERISWSTLRINGRLRAMSNKAVLDYAWDSAKERDGTHTIEIAAWASDRTLITSESYLVNVLNDVKRAGN